MKLLALFFPFSVQVTPGQATSIISMNNTIRIHHRNYFEDQLRSEILSFFLVTTKEINYSLSHQRTPRLSRVLSG